MEGKVAFVTGSTSGIGLGIARSLAKEGCSVILTGFGDETTIQGIVADIIKQHKVRCEYFPADLANVSEIHSMCARIDEIFPEGVDILVNNAGFNHVCPVDEYPDDKWDLMVAVMLTAPFHLTKHFLPAMKKKAWGRIVNMSSIHGLIATPGKAVYSTVKHGLVGFTKGIAIEYADHGILCNAICPSFVNTELHEKQLSDIATKENITIEEARQKHFLSKWVPTKQYTELDDVTAMVVFLCSKTGGNMTGVAINMDGGWLAN